MPQIYQDFTARDFSSLFEWLLTLLQEECPELSYSDYNHSDAGVALIRLLARASDSLSLYLDEAFAESFVHSAKFKQSLIDIARTVDLLPKMANAATAPLRITRKNTMVGTVGDTGIIYLPQWTPVTKDDGTQYLLTEAITMQTTDAYKDTTVINGTRYSYTLGLENFARSLNTGRYSYNIGANVASGTVTFVENSLTEWEEVESFWRSFSGDSHFVCEVYADLYNGISDSIFFTLGNGTQGTAPSQSSSYVLSFIKCDGAAGNTGTGTIKNISDYDYAVTVTNTASAVGGAGVEPIEDYRLRIPKVVRTQRRAVTKEDYEALVVGIPGVKRVQALDRNDSGEYPWEYVVLYVSPEGGGSMSETIYNAVLNKCTTYGALGGWYKRYLLNDVVSYPVDVTCTVGIEPGYATESVISLVTATVTSFFSVDNFDIGQVFYIGDLHSELMALSGVSWIELPYMVSIDPGNGYIITLGTTSITVGV